MLHELLAKQLVIRSSPAPRSKTERLRTHGVCELKLLLCFNVSRTVLAPCTESLLRSTETIIFLFIVSGRWGCAKLSRIGCVDGQLPPRRAA
jgi:hypothetical protein